MSGGTHFAYSIVIPVYCNEECLAPLFRALTTEVLHANPERSGEIVFVDDGSADGSFAALQRIRGEAPAAVTVIKLTRNFGQAGALLAGYEHARGDCVVTISADGQEPPSIVNEMLRGFFDEHYEIVICERTGRDEPIFRAVTSRLYFGLMRLLGSRSMPAGGFDAWLMGPRALRAFLRHPEVTPSLQWRVLWTGLPTKTIRYHRRARLAGVSRFTLMKRLNAALHTILGYSCAPIRLIWASGCALAVLGLTVGSMLLAHRLVSGQPAQAWALVLMVLLIVGGLQTTAVGMIGEYVWRTLEQVRNRDPYLIDSISCAEDPCDQP